MYASITYQTGGCGSAKSIFFFVFVIFHKRKIAQNQITGIDQSDTRYFCSPRTRLFPPMPTELDFAFKNTIVLIIFRTDISIYTCLILKFFISTSRNNRPKHCISVHIVVYIIYWQVLPGNTPVFKQTYDGRFSPLIYRQEEGRGRGAKVLAFKF